MVDIIISKGFSKYRDDNTQSDKVFSLEYDQNGGIVP